MTRSKKPLPSLPTVAVQLLSVTSNPAVSVKEIGAAIRNDPSLTGKVIRAANSSRYGIGRPISDVDRAVVLLGKRTVTTLALTFSLSDAVFGEKSLAKYYKEYWLESVVQAITAELLARQYSPGNESQFFTAGLLQDLGRLYLLQNHGDEYAALIETSRNDDVQLTELEKQAFEISHPDLTAGMLSEWQFPQQVAFAAAAHHKFHALGNPSPTLTLELALHISSLVGEYFCQPQKGIIHMMLEEALSYCPDSQMTADKLTDQVHEQLAEISDLFNIDTADMSTANEMLSEAMQQIASLATSLEDPDSSQSDRVELMRENHCLKQRLQEVMERVQIDPLTGVFTREFLDRQLATLIDTAATQNGYVGLLFIDVDHFKQINDTYGHLAGDKVLRGVAQSIGTSVRGHDFAARYGGEEFAVVVCEPDEHALNVVAERARRAIEEHVFVLDGQHVAVTASVGATLMGPLAHADGVAEQIVATADAAMYQAKRQGRNRVVVTSTELATEEQLVVVD